MTERARVHLSRSAPDAYKTLDAFSKTVGGDRRRGGHRRPAQGARADPRVAAQRLRVLRARARRPRGEAGVTADEIAQLPVWRESGVFSDA